MGSPTPAFTSIARLAAERQVHQAFQWLHLQDQRIMHWQTELVRIPAPPFGERGRAEWLLERFRELDLADPHIDEAGNVVATRPGVGNGARRVLLSAHIDTVFPAGTPIEPLLRGSRLEAPGACDNGAGVAAMLATAAVLQQARVAAECAVVFIGNVGEEGEGNLSGMRHIYRDAAAREEIVAHVVLDGAGQEATVTHALGSLRFLVTISGPGGHAWTDAGRPNPIVILSSAVHCLAQAALPDTPRTTVNVGTIEGGTAINAIPEQATARFDLRSTDPQQLIRLEVLLHRAVEDAVLEAGRGGQPESLGLRWKVEKIGHRPAGQLAQNSRLLEVLRAVDRHLSIRSEPRVASTDANIPLSLGVPAISIGGGGEGGGIHTVGEWYDGRGRELGLRRILLLLLALAGS